MTIIDHHATLPDPVAEPDFYDGVPLKRLIAWGADVVAIALLTAIVVPFTAFTALFYLPILYMMLGFLYRWAALSRFSATPGMMLAGIEIRRADAAPLDPPTAFLHTAGYTASVALFPAQLVSVALMVTTPRKQGLSDLVLGTAALRCAQRL